MIERGIASREQMSMDVISDIRRSPMRHAKS